MIRKGNLEAADGAVSKQVRIPERESSAITTRQVTKAVDHVPPHAESRRLEAVRQGHRSRASELGAEREPRVYTAYVAAAATPVANVRR